MAKSKSKTASIDVQLATAIRQSRHSRQEIAAGAQISEGALSRFLNEDPEAHRDLRLETAARVAAFLGLELAPRRSTKRA